MPSCDTSAPVTLGISEESRVELHAAAAIRVCRTTWAEITAARACRCRESSIDSQVIDVVRNRLRNDWNNCAIVAITQSLIKIAGDYADTFALRAYDRVQLTAARNDEIRLACFDTFLKRAAQVLGLKLL